MPLFSHAFGELAGKVAFGTLVVDAALSDVTAEVSRFPSLYLATVR